MSDMVKQSQAFTSEERFPNRRFLYGNAGVKYMIAMGLAAGGFQAVENITNFMIPLTVRMFTDSAFILAFILSLNRFFGFTVQPTCAWLSDRIETRFGRRRPFLLIGSAFTLLAIVIIAVLPYIFPGDTRHTLFAMIILMLANVALQFFQDMDGGVMVPLYADTFKQEQLGRAGIFKNYAGTLVAFTMTAGAFRLADEYLWFPYLVCCVWLTLSLSIVGGFIKERPFDSQPSKEKVKPIAFLLDFLRPLLRPDIGRLAIIGSLVLLLFAFSAAYQSLFIVSQLGLTMKNLASIMTVTPFVAAVVVIPGGYLTDRFGPKYVLTVGFLFWAATSFLMAFVVHSFWPLFIALNLFAAGTSMSVGALTPMTFQYAGPEERGSIFAVVQFCRGAATWIGTLVLGVLVQHSVLHEPTPFRANDLKQSSEFVTTLNHPKDEISGLIAAHLSESTRELMQQPFDREVGPSDEVKTSVVADMNKLINGPSIYTPDRFADRKLSKQSQDLIQQNPTEGADLMVLNRSLISDAYPEMLSRKVNYRIPYYITLAITLLGAFLTFTSPRGKYARTTKDAS